MDTTFTGQIALGAMYFGTRQSRDESFAILDRFAELGGRWLDTSDNYSFWESETGHGGASERMLGDWFAANPGARERMWISTKLGAEPLVAGRWPETMEGLSRDAVERALAGSLERLGTDHVDLLWAHVEDRATPLDEQVEALGATVADGRVGRLGASNHATWRVERARAIASGMGLAGYSALQLRHTYLQPVPFVPLVEGGHVTASPEALDYARVEELGLWAYSTLLSGAYARDDRPLQEAYVHGDTTRRLAALDAVARDVGATRNQVVLAWLLQNDPAVTPIVGVSSIAQLDEMMASRELTLDDDARAMLDLAS
ncbi:aldo/keto reductase [Demequina sp. NBRC 110052]|uniref:aldo/keto reductase n=1 Tax=Demequina sp. NBRC 110052 TaxID=1570341 RepID=UPI000A06C1B0|nr:aldo/keto reductase [Demequina sp. NBRC 110052]